MWEYCSKEDVADYSGVAIASMKDSWSEFAESMINTHTGRTFGGTQTYTESYDGDGTDTLILNNYPVSSVTSLAIGGTAVSSSQYKVYEEGYVRLVKSNTGTALDEAMSVNDVVFPKGQQNVTITYVANNSDVPGYVRNAATFMIAEIALVRERGGADGSLSVSRAVQRAGESTYRPRAVDITGRLRNIMINTIGDRWKFE